MAIVRGTSGNDTLQGTSESDLIVGGAGADRLDGGVGDDTLWSGHESPPWGFPYYDNPYTPPVLDRGTEVDTLIGGAGSDRLFAGYGDNVDGGEDGSYGDYLFISFLGATAGITVDFRLATQTVGGGTITGIEHVSWVEGSNFGDHIDARTTSFTGYADPGAIFGMGGNDTLIAGYDTATLDGGDGNDVVDGRNSQSLQLVEGGAGDDILYTNPNTVSVASGGSGNDIIYSHGETHGGDGNDTIVLRFSNYGGPVTGDAGDDQITGSFWLDRLEGNDGNDTIDGGRGDDLLDGGAGSDVLAGGLGDDRLSGGSEADRFLFGQGGGQDVITDFAAGDFVVINGYVSAQSLSQVGGDVVLVLSSTDRITFLNVDLATVQAGLQFAPPTDDVIVGSEETDLLFGFGGNDRISGNGGDDTLVGGTGADHLDGGEGSDTLFSDGLSPPWSLPYYGNPYTPPQLDRGTEVDTLNGGAGDDIIFAGYGDNVDGGDSGYRGDYLYISFQGATAGVTVDFRQSSLVVGGGTITGIENISWVEGSNYDDHINAGSNSTGYSDATTVLGMAGNDTLIAGYFTGVLDGGEGDDIVDGRSSRHLQLVEGGAGNDILYTNAGASARASGGDGDDTIYSHGRTSGGNGNDTIILSFSYYPDLVTGDAGDDTITGSAADDVLIGNSGADILTGGDGNDLLISGDAALDPRLFRADLGSEHDVISGGAGDDTLSIGFGDDADGGTGNDTLRLSLAGSGSGVTLDTGLFVAGQAVTIAGGTIRNMEAIDHLAGSAFADQLTIAAQNGPVTVDAGEGDDVVTASASIAKLNGGAGNDQLTGGSGNDVLAGNSGNDVLNGGAGDDILFGGDVVDDPNLVHTDPRTYDPDAGAGIDSLVGGAGNDLLIAGLGDSVDGGIGIDALRLSLTRATSGVTLDTTAIVAGQAVTLAGGIIQNIESVEFLIGSAFADNLKIGTQTGAITVAAGAGNDVITTGASTVRVMGGDGDDRFISGAAADGFYGDSGMDTVDYRNATAGVSVNLWQNSGANGDFLYEIENVDGSAFADTLKGSGYANQLRGGAGNDRLEGWEGNDLLDGGTGLDTLVGGVGDDIYVVDNAGDVIVEAASQGTDQLRATVSYTLGAGISVETMVAEGTAAINLTGNELANNLQGNSGANVLTGGAGNDTLIGNAGNDRLVGGTGADTMSGGTGNDVYLVDNVGDKISEGSNAGADEVRTTVSYTLAARVQVEVLSIEGTTAINLTGNELAQTLNGNDANNTLAGAAGNDTLFGRGGNDIIKGGAGNDILWGGAGNDIFAFEGRGTTPGKDQIMDFQTGVDKIDLRAFGISSAQVKSAVSGTNTILSVDSNRDGLVDFTITLVGVGAPAAGDYMF